MLENNQVVACQESLDQRSHSEFINPAIEKVLLSHQVKLHDLDYFGCGIGPGSFTGIRIAVSVLKTFSALLDRPIVEVTSLETLAFQAKNWGGPQRVLTLINAYKNMVYYNIFDNSGERPQMLVENHAVFVKNLDQMIPLDQDFWILGDGFKVYENYLPAKVKSRAHRPAPHQLLQMSDHPAVSSLARLAKIKFHRMETKDWSSLLPLYIRASEAEENKRGIKYIPL